VDDLAREDLLRRVAAALRVVGIVAVAPGVLCVPLGYGRSPKRDLSAFSNLADLGIFWRAGLVLLALGALILAASFLVPESEDEA
jgi:uncharacterized protein YjeT (DUF2065 family)